MTDHARCCSLGEVLGKRRDSNLFLKFAMQILEVGFFITLVGCKNAPYPIGYAKGLKMVKRGIRT